MSQISVPFLGQLEKPAPQQIVIFFVFIVIAVFCRWNHARLGYDKARKLSTEERQQLYKTKGLTKIAETGQGLSGEQLTKLYKDNNINSKANLGPVDQSLVMYGDSYTSPDYFLSLFSAYYFSISAFFYLIWVLKPNLGNGYFVGWFVFGFLFGLCLLVWIEKYDRPTIRYNGSYFFNLDTGKVDRGDPPGWGMPYPVGIFGVMAAFCIVMWVVCILAKNKIVNNPNIPC
jgi:hypothetical protein